MHARCMRPGTRAEGCSSRSAAGLLIASVVVPGRGTPLWQAMRRAVLNSDVSTPPLLCMGASRGFCAGRGPPVGGIASIRNVTAAGSASQGVCGCNESCLWLNLTIPFRGTSGDVGVPGAGMHARSAAVLLRAVLPGCTEIASRLAHPRQRLPIFGVALTGRP